MKIRAFQPGDEAVQAEIYNAAAAELPYFKPATALEIRRRTSAPKFDPSTRLYLEDDGRIVSYCVFDESGRISYPWCKPGFERHREALLAQVLQTMQRRRLPSAWAAYRGDWGSVLDFFASQKFQHAYDVINFAQDLLDMPTAPARPARAASPVQRSDLAALLKLAPNVLRAKTPAELELYLFNNPSFTPRDLFAVRDRSGAILALALLVTDPTFADPRAVDPNQPCFRHGAFGTEGLTSKRIKGMFSFLARDDSHLPALALDLFSQAGLRLQQSDDVHCLAAQVRSDVPYLLQFYERNFRRQGSFPVFEQSLVRS